MKRLFVLMVAILPFASLYAQLHDYSVADYNGWQCVALYESGEGMSGATKVSGEFVSFSVDTQDGVKKHIAEFVFCVKEDKVKNECTTFFLGSDDEVKLTISNIRKTIDAGDHGTPVKRSYDYTYKKYDNGFFSEENRAFPLNSTQPDIGVIEFRDMYDATVTFFGSNDPSYQSGKRRYLLIPLSN